MSDPYELTILIVPEGDRLNHKLAKTYSKASPDDAQLTRTEYSAGTFFKVVRKVCKTIEEWAAWQKTMSTVPHACLIRGEPIQGINPEHVRRLQSNFPNVPRCQILFDFDKPRLPRGDQGPLTARALLPEAFQRAPCWWQRTGSYGCDYVGRNPAEDPWSSKLRLGFMLDRPLGTPQLKRWLRDYRDIVDLAIYTSNQINYTANPIFENCIDPVLAAGEARFGTLDLAEALIDTVVVPDDIYDWQPRDNEGNLCQARPEHISDPKRATLLREAEECDEPAGNRHGTVHMWACNAYGLGMDVDEILDVGTDTLVRLGRDRAKAKAEVARSIDGAKNAMAAGTLWISDHLIPNRDFTPVDDGNDTKSTNQDGDPAQSPAAAPLTPAQMAAQADDITPWQNRLKISPSTGSVKNTLDNTVLILANHSNMKENGEGILAYDTFQDQPVWTGAPPWWRSIPKSCRPEIGPLGVPLNDADCVAAAVWLGHLDPNSGPEGIPIHISPDVAGQALTHTARYRTVNPAKAYFDKCAEAWDRTPRINHVLRDVCHATGNATLLKQWFPKWLMQSVARIYKPGSKCDAVLVFQGGQGVFKSTFFANLCPHADWFLDMLPDLRDKDAMQLLRGKLIVELSEMHGTKKDVDHLKAFIAKKDDTYRASFGKISSRHPRTMIFGGSTNEEECLTDVAGRRWWIVDCPTDAQVAKGVRFDVEQVARLRDQWWGEAVHRYRAGEEWWLSTDDANASAQVAMAHSAGLEQALDIHHWLNLRPENGGPQHPDIITAMDIWSGAMGRLRSGWNTGAGRIVSDVMRGVTGWIKQRAQVWTSKGNIASTVYVRDGSEMALDSTARNNYILKQSGTKVVQGDFTPQTDVTTPQTDVTTPGGKAAKNE